MATLVTGSISVVVMGLLAVLVVRWTGSATTPSLERREWHHAFWWSVYPNFMLLYTAYLLIFGTD